jgi:hypothetical protein
MAKDTFQFKKLTYNADLTYDKIECPLLKSLYTDFAFESACTFETKGTNLLVIHSNIRDYSRDLIEYFVYKGIMYKYKEMVNSSAALFEPI